MLYREAADEIERLRERLRIESKAREEREAILVENERLRRELAEAQSALWEARAIITLLLTHEGREAIDEAVRARADAFLAGEKP
jgi:hypothetical protein